MKTLSFILSILGLIAVTASSLIRGNRMKNILLLSFCGNLLFAASYLLGGNGLNGAASSLLGSVVAIINCLFDIKNRRIPKWLIVLYGICFIVLNICVGGISLQAILVILSSLSFVMCIGQKNGRKYRFWVTVNLLLLCAYDLLTLSYGTLVAHLAQLGFNTVGILLYDRKITA